MNAPMTDAEREARICSLSGQIATLFEAGDLMRAMEALQEQTALIKGRSAEQVARMDRERGLA